jgi:DNA gyrase subunit A
MVQRTAARGINRYGRASQGVRVMNVREDDSVSAVALVMESEAETAAVVEAAPDGAGDVDIDVDIDADVETLVDETDETEEN